MRYPKSMTTTPNTPPMIADLSEEERDSLPVNTLVMVDDRDLAHLDFANAHDVYVRDYDSGREYVADAATTHVADVARLV